MRMSNLRWKEAEWRSPNLEVGDKVEVDCVGRPHRGFIDFNCCNPGRMMSISRLVRLMALGLDF